MKIIRTALTLPGRFAFCLYGIARLLKSDMSVTKAQKKKQVIVEPQHNALRSHELHPDKNIGAGVDKERNFF